MTPAPLDDPTVLTTRVLEAHFQAREAFTRALDPVLRRTFDLDLRDYMILRWIERQDLTPGNLAQLLHVPGYATSRLLDPFIKRGLVQRLVDDTDARRYRLHLTDAGRAALRAIDTEMAVLLGRFLQDLGPERTGLLLDQLHAMAQLEALLPAEPVPT
ncbi:MarR family winged helix-turn-helix transcriptional regulator [Deinococcus sonorensis]|uniref:MarR family transcriptional regulator n=2 Tax=Deinococcus sonorensis TaxID=309891 RepID=A0AAU7U6L5_9DEIO